MSDPLPRRFADKICPGDRQHPGPGGSGRTSIGGRRCQGDRGERPIGRRGPAVVFKLSQNSEPMPFSFRPSSRMRPVARH